FSKLEVMRREARADQRDLLGLRIVDGEMPTGAIEREQLRRRMARALLAKRGIVFIADSRREPQASLAVEHGIVHVGFAAPDRLLAPVGRSSERLARNVGRIRIADR